MIRFTRGGGCPQSECRVTTTGSPAPSSLSPVLDNEKGSDETDRKAQFGQLLKNIALYGEYRHAAQVLAEGEMPYAWVACKHPGMTQCRILVTGKRVLVFEPTGFWGSSLVLRSELPLDRGLSPVVTELSDRYISWTFEQGGVAEGPHLRKIPIGIGKFIYAFLRLPADERREAARTQNKAALMALMAKLTKPHLLDEAQAIPELRGLGGSIWTIAIREDALDGSHVAEGRTILGERLTVLWRGTMGTRASILWALAWAREVFADPGCSEVREVRSEGRDRRLTTDFWGNDVEEDVLTFGATIARSTLAQVRDWAKFTANCIQYPHEFFERVAGEGTVTEEALQTEGSSGQLRQELDPAVWTPATEGRRFGLGTEFFVAASGSKLAVELRDVRKGACPYCGHGIGIKLGSPGKEVTALPAVGHAPETTFSCRHCGRSIVYVLEAERFYGLRAARKP